jgi:hypothetical protein
VSLRVGKVSRHGRFLYPTSARYVNPNLLKLGETLVTLIKALVDRKWMDG